MVKTDESQTSCPIARSLWALKEQPLPFRTQPAQLPGLIPTQQSSKLLEHRSQGFIARLPCSRIQILRRRCELRSVAIGLYSLFTVGGAEGVFNVARIRFLVHSLGLYWETWDDDLQMSEGGRSKPCSILYPNYCFPFLVLSQGIFSHWAR